MTDDFISRYIKYIGLSEAPKTFHRWAALTGIGAMLGKAVWFEHGISKVYPNLYVQLMGVAGSRKSTSIKRFTSLLRKAGFRDFAVEKTSKEKFIEWLSSRGQVDDTDENGEALWIGLDSDGTSTNVLIAADEFTDFFSTNILDFLSFLGVMWDYDGNYEHSTRAGGSVVISNPCVSILSGNTPTMLAKTIPPEAIGQGFFSRTIMVYGQETGIKIAFPEAPDPEATEMLVRDLQNIKTQYSGVLLATKAAIDICTQIYQKWSGPKDPRLSGYNNRRFNQLLKLCMLHTIADGADKIDTRHVIRANTVLVRAEMEMELALGEFGEARHAAVIHKILKIVDATDKPLSLTDIWEYVHTDLERLSILSDLLSGLAQASKIQVTARGVLPKKAVDSGHNTEYTDWEYLTDQEKEVKL